MSWAPGNAWVSASTLDRGPSGASSSVVDVADVGLVVGTRRPAVVDRHRRAAAGAGRRRSSRPRARGTAAGRSAPPSADSTSLRFSSHLPRMISLRTANVAASAVDRREPTVGEAAPDHRLEAAVDLRPGGDELVERDGRACRASRRVATPRARRRRPPVRWRGGSVSAAPGRARRSAGAAPLGRPAALVGGARPGGRPRVRRRRRPVRRRRRAGPAAAARAPRGPAGLRRSPVAGGDSPAGRGHRVVAAGADDAAARGRCAPARRRAGPHLRRARAPGGRCAPRARRASCRSPAG